jgi:hypothetical protein
MPEIRYRFFYDAALTELSRMRVKQRFTRNDVVEFS